MVSLVVTALVLAQGGSGFREVPRPVEAYKAALAITALIFLLAVIRGSIDLARPRPATAPKATLAVTTSRYWAFVLALVYLIVILLVLTGLVEDVRQLALLQWPMGILLLGQVWTAIQAWRNPEAKKAVQIVQTVLLVAALVAFPLFLLRGG